MPNWCEGTLKVRGKIKDLKKFVLEGLKPVDILGNDKEPLKFTDYDDWCELDIKNTCYIENTRRGFVYSGYIYFEGDDDEIKIICLECKFAWGISAEELQETCQKYGVDMNIYAFECGMEFNQHIEIVTGKIVKDLEIQFDNYKWECPCPNIGG